MVCTMQHVVRRLTIAAIAATFAAGLAAEVPQTAAPPQAPPQPQTPRPAAPARKGPPRLVVLIVVDQMRADYVDRYAHQWTGGLRRIFEGGAYFTRAAYLYGGTVTCPGHATISTGAQPIEHGMVGNEWFDYKAKKLVPCMNDPSVTSIPFGGGKGTEHHSPRNLMRPTFTDELRRQIRPHPRIVSVALKPRSAIALAGHPGANTMAVWEEDDGTWATSDAYTKVPWPEVNEYVQAHPVTAAYGEVWNRVLPVNAYVGPDDGPGEASPVPWGRTFPHPLISRSGKPDNAYVTTWERSPWSDAYVTGLVMHLAQKLELGTGAGTDVLAMSFPSLDTVGHQFGPTSHEVQDVLVRLDGHLGRLLDLLDTQVGRGEYVLALSADHGTAMLPEQVPTLGYGEGRISSTTFRDAIQRTLEKEWGKGTYYGGYASGNIYLQAGVADAMRARPGLIQTVKAALMATGGVARVYWRDELAGTNATSDPFLEAWRLGYYASRSGDFIVVPKRDWLFVLTGTSHGSVYEYDRRVPLVFYGAGIRPGRYDAAAAPVDLAPTLAAIVGIKMPKAEGWILSQALAR
jgi:predicted AlkP superfamily pyrophosphatase or phosphodiesterase